MRSIQLVRHPPVAIPAATCYGQLDVPLVDDWQAKSPILHNSIDLQDSLLISSPASRCRLLAHALTSSPHIDGRLQELDFGQWEGMLWDHIDRRAIDHWAADYIGRPVPGGESYLELFHRVSHFLDELMMVSQSLVIVTHAGVIRACLCWLFRRRLTESFDWHIPFGSPLIIEFDSNFSRTQLPSTPFPLN